MGIKVNLAGVKTELVPVPPGRYRANVFAMGLKTSKNDNEMLEVQYKISPEHEEEGGRTMYDNLVLIPNSLWRMKRTLIALGDEPDDLDAEFEIDADFIEQYIGRECVLDIKHEMYQGEARARISRVLPVDAPLEQEGVLITGDDII